MAEFSSEDKTPDVVTAVEEPTINPFVKEDLAFVEGCLPPAAIQTLTAECLTVIIIRTPYARIQLRVLYGSNYPNEPPIVELASPTLPMPLLRNKERECVDKCTEPGNIGKAQFQVIYDYLHSFIHSNMFVPCWKEMKQIASLVEGKGQIGIDEKEGVIQLRLKCNQYQQNIKLKVPYNYPVEGVVIEFLKSNFPQDIQIMFKGQVDELVRKFEAGFTAEQAFATSTGPIKLPTKASGEVKTKVTTESLKNLKHDVSVLKQISDLRAASTAHDSKRYFTQANADRREARKDLRRLAKAETEAEKEQQRQLLEEEQKEMQSLLRATVSDTAQPSLFHCAKYLVEQYTHKLPLEKCQACKESLLAADPESESNKNSRSEKRAMRTFCGHWLHYNCLNNWLTTPPFVRNCEICTRRIWHPDWPEDYKQLEKAWQSKEARKREVSDVSDFMGMGSDFRA